MRWIAFVLIALILPSCTGGEEQATPPAPPEVTIGATRSPEEVVVAPDLIGVPVKEVGELLKDVGLQLGDVQVIAGDYTDAVIIKQHPRAGTEMQPGTAIDVVIGAAIDVVSGAALALN